ncbi:MAG: T9SS type B sorting domain-containing protein [Maribacter arcticus]|uniref:T9SS type B sorting domain-containing protein n=1 Tax=Maribacter arcticus TaxID=561365 RepID=UPI0030020DB6
MTKLTSFLDFTKFTSLMGKHYAKCLIFILFLVLGAQTAYSQVKEPFQVRYEADIRGELTFIANSIVAPSSDAYCEGRGRNRICYPARTPNDAYNVTGSSSEYNDNLNMQYIDVDNDNTTFSSSSATLTVPNIDCALVRYAGLYWSAVYVNNDRSNIDDIKFRTPDGAYQDITADEIIFDGNADADFGYYSPYAAYKDVTSIVAGMTNPNGEYFVANVRASTGSNISGGISGGWKMVVVYEDPNLPGDKFITTFDGYAGIKSGQSVDIPINGFTTLPAPFPVYANMGVAALEGDNRIGGDALQINANGTFNTLSNGENPANNFFNSSISINDNQFNARNPNSSNTLGWDVDMFEIPNGGAGNTIIPNDATSAILRASSSQDKYDIFFTSFDVDIIAPNIILEKRVNTPGGTDITGQGVNLGQTLDYVLTFDNIGNDDGGNYVIKDVLPINVSPPDGRNFFIDSDFTLPPGVTYTYDPSTQVVIFTIPDLLVEAIRDAYSIRMRVQVAENCFDFINACSDLIENIAYSTYTGIENSALVTDDPSVTDFNTCGFTVPGATNFLLDDLSDCNFNRTVELCGASAQLNAGDGFDSYVWYQDTNNNGNIDASDIEINDGDPDNDPSTINVTTTGTYIVDKIIADPCKGFKEIITVEPYGSGSIPNPIIEYFNEVNGDTDPSNNIPGEIVSCSVDSSLLPKIFLCGINDSHLLQVYLVDAQSVVWEKLDEASCSASGDDCANKALTCTWDEVGTGSSYRLNSEGQYRLSVTYQNGCTSRFYFNGFQNDLDLQYTNRDIVCETPGNISITNLGNGYGYQLVDDLTNNIIIPFSANNGPSFDFTTGENGSYRVEVTQLDINGDLINNTCVFTTPVIGVLDRVLTTTVSVTAETCFSQGAINIQINNADPAYEYEIRRDDGTNGGLGTLVDSENGQTDNNFTFSGLIAGDYIAIGRTTDGCSVSENVTILDENDLFISARVSQHITCKEGNILMDSGGGKTPHTYAIWNQTDVSGNSITSYPTYADIPASNFQTSAIFDIFDPGDYAFVVLDRNGCYSVSNTVSIEFQPAADFNATTVVDVLCFGESSGRIQYNLVDNNGYSLTFTLYDSNNIEIATNTSGNFPNLPTGDYIVSINQRKGSASCDYNEEYTITAPTSGLSAEAILIQDYTCLQEGIIEAQNVSGGTASYEYSIDGINFIPDTTANAHRFENLTDGTYTVTIRDANDCTFVTNQIVIDRPNPPTDLTIVESQITCPAQTVNLTVNAINGTAPYTYSIIAPSTMAPTSITGNEAAFNGLAPDTYTVRVTDADGCFYDENYTINAINPISASGTTTQPISCFGAADGIIRFNVNFQVGQNFTYTVTGPTGVVRTGGTASVIDNINGLVAGDYTLDIVDTDTNCTYTLTHELEGPTSALTISNLTETQPSCLTDGSVSISATGGWGSYTYALNNPDASPFGNNTTGSFSGLTQSGTYNGTITDANNCSIPFSFDLNPATAPVLEITPNQNCFDDAVLLTLTANVTSGGDGNFEYSLNGGPFSTTNVFSGLSAGTYTIDVRDGKDCTDSESITINPALTVSASASNITACGTDTDIDITAAGGDGNYVYAVVADGATPTAGDYATTNPVTVTGAGDYDVYVLDNNGGANACPAMYDITIVQDAPVAATPTVVDVTCFGGTNGSISLAPSGGEAPYTFSIDGGTTFGSVSTFNNLTAGTYDVRVRDVNNCELTLSVPVDELPQIIAESVQTEDYTCNQLGEITVGGITPTTGGSNSYQYSLNGGTWTAATAAGAVFANLTDGTYTVQVRDANNIGCTISLPNIIIAPLPIEPALSSSVAYNCDGSGNITILPNNPSYTYSIDGNTPQASNVFNNAIVGQHTITVDYGSECTTDIIIDVQPGNAFEASVITYENLDCNADNSGTITFEVDNFGASGFEYSLDNFVSVLGSTTVSPQTISGLSAGNYSVYVRDIDNPIAGCTVTLTQTISEPSVLVADANITQQYTCDNGGATITASALGGTPGYEYQLEDNVGGIITAYQTNTVFSGLLAGTYNVRAMDANGCSDLIDNTITINAPATPVFTLTETICYSGSNDATIQVDVTAGNGNYLFRINGGTFVTPSPVTATTYTFTGLSSGTYTIEVTDQYGCDTAPQTITIEPQLTVSASASNITACGTDTDIDITAAGGDGNYVYAVVADGATPTAGDYATTNPVTVTGAGDYDVYVLDNNGGANACPAMYDITIVQDAPVAATPTVVDVTCFGGTNGSISLAPSGGEAPYTFSIDGGTTFGSVSTFNNLTAGTYDVRVRDVNNCELTLSVPVDELPQIIAESVQTEDYTCNQLGEITVGGITPTTGGSNSYQYSLNGGTWTAATAAGAVFANLTDGTYTVQVRDANNIGCTISLPNIIIAPLPIEPSVSSSIAYNCDGSGNITILPNDPSYTYSIDGNAPQASNVFNNAIVGQHTITVDYGSECTTDIIVDVQAGNAFEASVLTYEDLDCNADNSGTITFEVNNFGASGYEYSYDSGFATIEGNDTATSHTISGLSAGNYTVYVRDIDNPIAGCTVTLTQTILEPNTISVSNVETQPSCVDDGSVIITATGGTGAFSYEIELPDTSTTGAQGSNLFTGLNQLGLHTITVTDANGCTATDTFTLVAPSLPTASIDPTSDLCYDSSNPGSATIVIGASGGLAPYVYRMNTGAYKTSNDFANLTPGNYTFQIRDANGCTDTLSFTIEPQLTANVVLTKDIDCSASPDASLDLQVNGGYSPFTYELQVDGGGYTAYIGSFPYSTATPGLYRFRVTDAQGCSAESNEITVTATVNPVATETVINPTCFGDANGVVEINIDPSYGSSPFQISFEGSSFSNQRVYPGLAAGTYTYTVRDSKSCVYTDTVTVTDPALFDAIVVATDVSCGGTGDIPGKIDITITSGGAPNFTYTLYDNQNNVVVTTGPNPIVNTSATTATFDGLTFGDYYVRVLDANGCEFYQNPVRVLSNPYLSIDAVVPAVSCVSGGTVDLLASGGSGNYDFTIYGAGTIPNSETSGPGINEESATYNGLNPGQTYVFQVIDTGTNCSSYVEVDIPSLSSIDVVANPIITDVACFGDTNGSIAFQIEGYDSSVNDIFYEIRESITNTSLGGAYSNTIIGAPNGPGPTAVETVTNIPPGDYVLFFREDSSPDCTNTFEFRILEPNPVTLTIVDQNNGYCTEDANVTVIAGGGNGSYTYAFVEDGVSPVSGDYGTSNYAELDPFVNTDWDIYVLDGNGCSTTLPLNVAIAEDSAPVISAVVLNQCAADEGEFTIEVTLDGEGIQPYTLSVNGGSYQSSTLTTLGTTHQFNNLSSGNYTIEVRDFNGCGNIQNLEIFKPTSITAEVTTQPTCIGNDGEVIMTAYGGSGVYMYELFDAGVSVNGSPQASPIFTGLEPKTYQAFVYDQILTGCDKSVDIELEVPTVVAYTTSVTEVSCFGGSDGRIVATLDPTMDNPPYTYQLFQRPLIGPLVPVTLLPQTSNIFNNLSAADNYVVRVYSGRGCILDEDVIVNEPDAIANLTTTVVDFGCSVGNNPNNATITIDGSAITGGSGNYVIYEFVDSGSTVVQSGASNILTVTDRTGDTYTINVYDDNGCSGTTTATVLPFDEMTGATAAVTTTVTCAPGSDGVITVTATSTASDNTKYEYSIDNGTTYVPTNVFGGLSAGTYNFLVRHTDTGCIVTTSARIEEPNTFTIDVVKTSDVVCFGTTTGEVTFELVDATYTTGFDWDVFLTDGTPVINGSEAANGPTPIVNLGVGEYYVSISQANNPFCTNVEYFNIAGPDADISGATAVTDITCVPGNDGSITIIDVVGGWGGYTYYVGVGVPVTTDFVAGASFTGLVAGTYQAWARDAQGCERLIQDNIILDVPTAIAATLQVNQENCTNLQGEIEVSLPTGGQGSNYTYQLIMDGSNFRAPQNTRVFSGLGAGSYEVLITDQWGCNFTTLAEVLYEQLDATTTVVKSIDCTATPGGTITVNVTGGSANLEFVMTPPTGPNVTQANNPTFTGLVDDGTYSFLVRDLYTTNPVCERTVTQELAPAILPDFDETHIDITCFGSNDGSITLTQTENGVNPLTFTISPAAGTFNASSNTFENLPPNTYNITATGTNGCPTTITGIIIVEPLAILNVNADVVEFGCSVGNNPNNATITIDGSAITGGSGNYVIYEFVDGGATVVQSGASNILTVTDRTGDTYTINVYDDNGCSGTTTATVLPFDEMTGATAAVTTTVTCAPGSDGVITVTATSTASDNTKYEYSIDNGTTYVPTNVFGGLSAGTYNFLVRHTDTGCIVTTSARIEEPNTFTIDVVKTSDVVCFGTTTGEVTFELVDATYTTGFDWDVFLTDGTPVINGSEAANGPTPIVNLGVGEYYVSISQANNPFCTNVEYFNIAGPDADISGATAVTDITCVPGNDGSITIIDVVGGWGGYTYYVGVGVPVTTDFVAGASFTGLVAGTYQAWARDAQGCERLIQDNIILDVPTAIAATLQVNQENCTNLQGEIEVSLPTGGQGSNYTYQLIMDGSNFRAPQNTRVFSGLGAGSYEVLITDQWGCNFTTLAEVLYEQLDATTTVVKSIDCTATPGGEITVNVNGGSTNLEFIMTTPLGSVITQITGVFTNLTEVGTYSILVRDNDTTNPVCERTVTQELDAPVDPVLLDATLVNVSCFGGNDGSIRANIDPATNVNPVYQYELYEIADLVTPIATQINPLFTGLVEGDYQVRVISSRGCEGIKNETITQPAELTVSAVATEFSCSPSNSVNTARVTATAGAGTGTAPYLYSIDNIIFQASNIFNITDNGSAQTIDVYVKDAKGCTTFDTVTVQPLNTFSATVAPDVEISCINDETVIISVVDNGLVHNYGYELLPLGNGTGTLVSTTATSATFELSAVGSYVFRVTDLDTGCYVNTASYTVAPFDFITATAIATTAVTCFGELNGSLEIDIDGYTGNYNYEVFNAAGVSVIGSTASDTSVNPRTITGLSGGSYYVTITETAVPLCSEDTNIVTISSPDRPLSGTVTIVAEATCSDDKGEIRVAPQGGYKPYDIVLTNTTTGDSYSMDDVQEGLFTNLSAGDYSVRITDNSGCIVNYTETMTPATPIVANATPLVTDLVCFGDTGATVSANVTGGGSGAYRYQLNYYDATGSTITSTTGAQNNPNFNDLGVGIYSITVVDGWDCDTVTNTVEITQPTEVQASLLRTDPLTCSTGAEFELTATGGSGTYEYSVDNINFLPMTSNPLGLPETGIFQEGTYQYYVRDAINGCESVISNAITETEIAPLILTVDKTAASVNCTGENTAIIFATAQGGLGNYQYELFTDSSLAVGSRIAGPQSQGVFRDLGAGTYYVTVISQDCTTAAEEVVIVEPTPLSYTESVIDVTCAGENDGEITVTLSGGAGGFQYAISPNLNQFFDNNTFTDLEPGEYTIIAQDQNGCFEYLTYTISEPASLVVSAETTPEICVDSQDGTIVLEISGGTAPYSTALNSSDNADFVLNRTEFLDMASGEYIIIIKDANGCDTNVVVEIERGVNLNATIEPIYECSGDTPSNYVNITLEDDSVIGDILYAIDSVDPADLQLNPDFRNTAPGSHYITIAHENGCIQTIDFVIEAFDPLTLSLEQRNMNEITAIAEGGREEYTYYFDDIDNGDKNTFYITRTDTYEVRVVDQNGCESIANIFMEFIDIELPNFFTPDGDGQNDFWIPRNMEQFPEILIKIFDRYGRVVSEQSADSEGWDGLYSGKELPTGDYWYVIKLNGERDEREFVGHFTLYR